MVKRIKTFIISYVASVGGIWGLLEAYTYFEGGALKERLGVYWWLVIYIFPVLISIGVIAKANTKDDPASSENAGKTIIAGGDLINGNVVNIHINKQSASQDQSANTSREGTNRYGQSFDKAVGGPIRVMFRDGTQKEVGLSVVCQVVEGNAPKMIANYGDYENAQERLQNLIEATVLTVLESHTLDEVRQSRGEMEKKMLKAATREARKIGFTIQAIKLKEIL